MTMIAGAREQSRARYPDQRGLRRTRRREALLRGLRRRRGDDPAAADVVDHPLAPLEGADPVPRRATSASSRSTAAATASPTARAASRPTSRPSSPPTRIAVMDATGTESAVLVGLSCGALWGTMLAADHPERVPAIAYIGPAVPLAPGPSRSGRSPRQLRGGARHRRGLGEVQPPLLAARLPGLPRVLLRADVQRAALDQADRGLRGLGARDRPGDAGRHDGRAEPVRHRALRRHRRARASARCS